MDDFRGVPGRDTQLSEATCGSTVCLILPLADHRSFYRRLSNVFEASGESA